MRVPDVAFETRDDHSDHRDGELRAGQVDGDDPAEPGRAQLFELPAQVSTQIIAAKARNFAEYIRLALLAQCLEQRIDNVGVRRLLIFRWQQIVANAGDVRKPGLRCLAQRAGQRDGPIGMAAGAMEMPEPARLVGGRIADIAKKGGNADIRRDIPYPHVDAGLLVFG